MSERITVNVPKSNSYDIVVNTDFNGLQDELIRLEKQGKKACIVTDSVVKNLYTDQVKEILEKSEIEAHVFSFTAGEEQKNLDTIEMIYEFLIQNNFKRTDFLVALGGGVVGDMTGYAAATYLRGVDFIQVPTTLLSQVDSSVGGKTGVDFKQYKNMVGAFKMPCLVYMNISTLLSLDDRQFYNGFAEAMKSALIKDAHFYEWQIEMLYEISDKELPVLEELVVRSCNIKRLIVEKDPHEKGDRVLLNLGHTIGHALEKYKNFTMGHGECVALGCIAAAFISWKKELLSMDEYYEIRDMFVPFNLPISIEDIDIEEILSITKSDKKNTNDGLKFVLLKKIGKAVIDTTVTDDEIRDALKEIQYIDEND